MKKKQSGFLTRSDTYHAVQSHKMARSLRFQIKKIEASYYLWIKKK